MEVKRVDLANWAFGLHRNSQRGLNVIRDPEIFVTYARFLESWDICQVAIDFLQLSIRYLFVLLQENVTANWSRRTGSTNTPPDVTSVTGFFNA